MEQIRQTLIDYVNDSIPVVGAALLAAALAWINKLRTRAMDEHASEAATQHDDDELAIEHIRAAPAIRRPLTKLGAKKALKRAREKLEAERVSSNPPPPDDEEKPAG